MKNTRFQVVVAIILVFLFGTGCALTPNKMAPSNADYQNNLTKAPDEHDRDLDFN